MHVSTESKSLKYDATLVYDLSSTRSSRVRVLVRVKRVSRDTKGWGTKQVLLLQLTLVRGWFCLRLDMFNPLLHNLPRMEWKNGKIDGRDSRD